MFSLKSITSILALATLISAAPTNLNTDVQLIPPFATFCTGSISPRSGCADIPVVADTCVSFTGGLTFLNDEVSSGQIPVGFACTVFDGFGCFSSTGSDTVFLQGGTYSFFNVPGVSGPVNFNDKASSFSCSPIF
ncbi:hypothetical protein BDZ94DRAFT_1308895 [Collybia nuda]|uniref:Uncharacterized protein n=1 Tax=Collybia nuda TaxID=64659 RepID=A0A9P5Y4Y9_9AGAR|nr:hypothetical protein BDZ94DRAFT_1308895 [Collybia nuda]